MWDMEFEPINTPKGTGADTGSMKWDGVRIRTLWQFKKKTLCWRARTGEDDQFLGGKLAKSTSKS